MTSEQPGLFEELAEQLDQARTEAYLIAEAEDYSYLPFLPGVEVGQAYPEIKDLGGIGRGSPGVPSLSFKGKLFTGGVRRRPARCPLNADWRRSGTG
jgi:hypothetical protein